jgi:hypothetical protein
MKNIQRTFLAFLLAAVPALAADGIAFITNLKGEVAVDGNPRPILLSELSKGQKLTVGRDSHASVMYIASGKEYMLKGPNDYLVKDTEIASTTGMPPVTRETPWRASTKVLTQVAQTSAASVRMRSVALPKADTSAKLLFPTEGSVANLQPTFRWRGPEQSLKGDFTLFIIGQEKPVHSGKAAAGAYKLPAKLKPETEYAWTLTAAGGHEVGTGRFRTLSNEALAQVEKRRPGDKSDFSDRLLFTLMLHEMGATQEAQESWARLAQERGDLPELASFAR